MSQSSQHSEASSGSVPLSSKSAQLVGLTPCCSPLRRATSTNSLPGLVRFHAMTAIGTARTTCRRVRERLDRIYGVSGLDTPYTAYFHRFVFQNTPKSELCLTIPRGPSKNPWSLVLDLIEHSFGMQPWTPHPLRDDMLRRLFEGEHTLGLRTPHLLRFGGIRPPCHPPQSHRTEMEVGQEV